MVKDVGKKPRSAVASKKTPKRKRNACPIRHKLKKEVSNARKKAELALAFVRATNKILGKPDKSSILSPSDQMVKRKLLALELAKRMLNGDSL